MKLKRILTTTGLLLLYAGATFASTSGFASLDQSLTGFGNLMQNGVGYGLGIAGGAAFAYHFLLGSDWAHTIPRAMTWGASGAAVHNAAVLSGTFGGAAAALIQPVLTHPATHLVLTHLVR
jgi:hypothetical protein